MYLISSGGGGGGVKNKWIFSVELSQWSRKMFDIGGRGGSEFLGDNYACINFGSFITRFIM